MNQKDVDIYRQESESVMLAKSQGQLSSGESRGHPQEEQLESMGSLIFGLEERVHMGTMVANKEEEK